MRSEELFQYGEFQNVKLSLEEHGKLNARFGEDGANDRIEALSVYLAAKHKKYASHYAVILMWERKNGNGKSKHVHSERCKEYGFCPEER